MLVLLGLGGMYCLRLEVYIIRGWSYIVRGIYLFLFAKLCGKVVGI